MQKTLIVIPTYNEKDNIVRLIEKIKALKLPADILVVDDSSPDGTGRIVEKISKKNKTVFILHRKKKEGLGRAYVAGFKWGLRHSYQKLVSMDADFSHPPEALSKMIKRSKPDRVVIGSRYIKGGKITGWGPSRYLNSWGANFVTRSLLGIRAKDATAGFKCYPAEFLRKINLDKIQAGGYAFQVEMVLLAQDNGFKLVETPIVFADRTVGESKIKGELSKSAKIVFQLVISRKTTRQFIKFVVVGAICTVIDWGVFYPVKILLGRYFPRLTLQQTRQIAKATSFIVAVIVSYLLNRTWTFRSTEKKVASEAFKFMVVATAGLVFNSSIFYFVTAILHWRDIFGLIIATVLVTLWNFLMNKKWTFKGT